MAKGPRVVAELGRPETPEETAARKAESSRLYRQRKTFRNLAASLLVCVVAVAVLVFMVPRDDSTPPLPNVDYASAAAQLQSQYPVTLRTPALPANWSANAAEIRTGSDGVTEWYIGFLDTDGNRARTFVGLSQGIDANPTWVAAKIGNRAATGTTDVNGVEWTVFDFTSLPAEDTGNAAYALTRESADGSMLVLYGSGKDPAGAVHTLAGELND